MNPLDELENAWKEVSELKRKNRNLQNELDEKKAALDVLFRRPA